MSAMADARKEIIALPVRTVPWTATLAALVSFAALGQLSMGMGPLFATFNQFPAMLIALGVALLAAKALPYRFSSKSWFSWIVRVVLMSVVVLYNIEYPCRIPGHGIYGPEYIHAFGQLCAAELVLQAWKDCPSGGPGGYFILMLSGLVFLAACNTFEYRHLVLYAPIYSILTFHAVRASRTRVRPGWRSAVRMPAVWCGAVAIVLALGVGYATTTSLFRNKDRLASMVRQLDKALFGKRSTGFSDEPKLGKRLSLQRGMGRILRLEGTFPGAHLRGMTFDTYRFGRWGPLIEQRRLEASPATALHAVESSDVCRVTRLVDGYPLLFAPLNAAGVVPERVQEVERDINQGAVLRVNVPAPYSYEVHVPPRAHYQGPLCAPLTTEERKRCLALPKDLDPEVARLAERVAKDAPDARAKAMSVAEYLVNTHYYSLEANPGAGDPVADFILHEERAAHCEYFASAAAVMLRCLKVPTRYVVGYYAHEGRSGGTMVVREQDAHAWCEAWIDGLGWMTVEATPAGGLPDRAATVSWWRLAMEWVQDTALAIGDWFMALSYTQLGALLAGVVAVVVLWLWFRQLFVGRRKGNAKRDAYTESDIALRDLAVRFEAVMERVGAPCPASRTWQEHLALWPAGDAENKAPALPTEPAGRFVSAYYQTRFGRPGQDDMHKLEEMLKVLER